MYDIHDNMQQVFLVLVMIHIDCIYTKLKVVTGIH